MKTVKLSLALLFASSIAFAQTTEIKKENKSLKNGKTIKEVKNVNELKVQPTPATIAAPLKPEIQAPATPATPTKVSELKWEKDVHEFGEIEKGKPVSYEFTFTNTTNETVLITNVKPSCGCTATEYTKTPIKPGEKGSVTATYNAASEGAFHKTVTITTNEADAMPKILTIKGKVKPEEVKEEKSILIK